MKSAAFENGLLKIELFREIPEAMKPRRIAIKGAPDSNVHQLERQGRVKLICKDDSPAGRNERADQREGK